MDAYQICIILFSAVICAATVITNQHSHFQKCKVNKCPICLQFRTGYQNQAKSSLEQGQVSGGPAAHPHQNFCSVPSPPSQVNSILLYERHCKSASFTCKCRTLPALFIDPWDECSV